MLARAVVLQVEDANGELITLVAAPRKILSKKKQAQSNRSRQAADVLFPVKVDSARGASRFIESDDDDDDDGGGRKSDEVVSFAAQHEHEHENEAVAKKIFVLTRQRELYKSQVEQLTLRHRRAKTGLRRSEAAAETAQVRQTMP